MKVKRLISAIALCFALATSAFAAEYYVNSATGSDANNGSIGAPWATMGGKTLAPGDTVFCEGTFTSQTTLSGLNGTSATPITYKSYGSGAILEHEADDHTYGFYVNGGSNIVIDGFTFRGWYRAIQVEGGTSNLRITNCKVIEVHNGGGGEGCGFWIWEGSNITVDHCVFKNVGVAPNEGCVITGPSHNGVFIYNNVFDSVYFCTRNWNTSGNVQFKNNICYNVVTAAIHNSANVDSNTRAHNIYYNVPRVTDSNGMNDGGGELWDVNPNFTDGTADDLTYVPDDNSPAIDAGVEVGFAFEGDAPDIGITEKKVIYQCTITGVVKDSNGSPVNGAIVSMDGGSTRTTGTDGVYSFGTTTGTYDISVKAKGFYPQSKSVTVTSGTKTEDFVMVSRPTGATAFCVDFENGDDTNSGADMNNAWKTFDNVNLLAEAGDTVYIIGTADSPLNLRGLAGTAAAPIWIHPAGYAAVDIPVTSGAHGLTLDNCSYVNVNGINVIGGEMGVYVTASHHCVLMNSYIHDVNVGGGGEGCGIWEIGGSHHNTFVRNFIIGVHSGGPAAAFTSGAGSVGTLFTYNTVLDVSNGIRTWSNSTVTATNNIFYHIRGLGEGNNAVFHSDHPELGITANNNICYDYPVRTEGAFSGENLWDVNPLFNNPSYDDTANIDITFPATSPAVDAGNDTSLVTFTGAAPDLGAWESPYVVTYGYVAGQVMFGGNAYRAAQPLKGATVTVGEVTATTDADGLYNVRVPVGSYIAAATYGESASDSAGITVSEDQTTQQDFTISASTDGNVWYVSPEGDDWGAGTEDEPFANIDVPDEFEYIAPGDTVIVKEGTYTDPENVRGYVFNKSGDIVAPIIYTTDGGEVVIDMQSYTEVGGEELISGMFFCYEGGENPRGTILNGFTFVNSQFGAYFNSGPQDVLVSNCVFKDGVRSDILGGGPMSNFMGGLTFILGADNTVKNCVFDNIVDPTAAWVYGIGMPGCSGMNITHNTFINTTAAVADWVSGATSGNVFNDNIVMNMTGEVCAFRGNDQAGISAANNLFFGNASNNIGYAVTDAGDNFIGNPELGSDYIPGRGSLAIAAASDGTTIGAKQVEGDASDYMTVSGKVVIAGTNTPIAGATVVLDGGATFVSAADGTFGDMEYRTTSDMVEVQASADLYAPYYGNISLTAGENNITVELEYAAYTFTGTVVDAFTQAPVAGASVVLGGKNYLTDENGVFVAKLINGEYEINITAPRYTALSDTVTVSGDGDDEFPLVAREYNTYYVNSATGNDSNPGTEDAPWQTILGNKAQLAAGDMVYVTGTFNTTTEFNGLSGDADFPITFKAYGEGALVQTNNSNGTFGMHFTTASNIEIDGFAFTGNMRAIYFDGSTPTNVRITNCRFYENHRNGSGEGAGIWIWNGSGIKIDHCIFENNGMASEGCIVIGNGTSGDSYIYNNVFANNIFGIRVWGNDVPVRVANNIFYGQTGAAMYSDRPSGSTHLYNNCLFGNTNNYSHYGAGEGWTDHGGSIELDPMFIDDVFHVSGASPVIDAGIDVGFGYTGSAPDMGLYETAPDVPVEYNDLDSAADLADVADDTYVATTFDSLAFNGSTAFADGSVYAGDATRLYGIKFVGADVAAGDVFKVKGQVKSDADGKYILVTEVTSETAGDAVKALGLTTTSLDTNVLVRVWGKVVSASGDTVVINNGSGDVTIKGGVSSSVGNFITVTGIATKTGVRAIEVR